MILILAWVFVPFYERSMVLTMPEFLEKRFNKQSRTILTYISLISYVLTKVAVTVYAGGVVFQQVFGIEELWGIDFFWIAAIGLVILTAIYTILGGMESVLKTSVLQTPILLVGSIVILVLGLKELGGWNNLMTLCDVTPAYEGAQGTMIHLMRGNSDPQYPWLGALIGSAVIGFWYWCTDQFIVQRVLSGKNEGEARRGAIFGAYLKLLPVFLFLIPGMIAFALAQGAKTGVLNSDLAHAMAPVLTNGDVAFPLLVAKLLPAGFKGVVVCGILAALMSSLASLFNSSAMLYTIDVYKVKHPDPNPVIAEDGRVTDSEEYGKKLVKIGQIATVIIVALGILWIPVMKSIGDVLYLYLQDVQSVLAPGIAAAFLMGICWKRATPKGGQWALISGLTIGIIRLGAKILYTSVEGAPAGWFKAVFYDFNWLYFCGCMLVFCLLVCFFVSLFTQPKPESEIKGLVFGTSTPEQKEATKRSWTKWDVIHSIIILGITVAFYIYFW
jgi:SSS family solute:Na+ symporter